MVSPQFALFGLYVGASQIRFELNPNGNCYLVRETAAGSQGYHGQFVYTPSIHKYFRVRHVSGTTWAWETSSDGDTWTIQAQVPLAAEFVPTAAKWVMYTVSSYTSIWDNFTTSIPSLDTLLAGQTLVWDSAQGKFVTAYISRMPRTAGAPALGGADGASVPYAFDPATNKLFVHNGTIWVSTTLA